MKIRTASINLYLVLFLLAAHGIATAQAPVRTDYEILESLYSECLRSIGFPSDANGGSVFLSFPEGIIPEKKPVVLTEAILSEQGFSITDESAATRYRMVIYIDEASVTLRKTNHKFSRDSTVHLYARCLDSSGTVLYAGNSAKTCSDIVSEPFLHTTDTGSRFSKNIHRTVLGEKTGKFKIASFLVITAVLAYFGLTG